MYVGGFLRRLLQHPPKHFVELAFVCFHHFKCYHLEYYQTEVTELLGKMLVILLFILVTFAFFSS